MAAAVEPRGKYFAAIRSRMTRNCSKSNPNFSPPLAECSPRTACSKVSGELLINDDFFTIQALNEMLSTFRAMTAGFFRLAVFLREKGSPGGFTSYTMAAACPASSKGPNDNLSTAPGTFSSGIGAPANRRRQGLAKKRTHLLDRVTRALSVAIPVSAYIWR